MDGAIPALGAETVRRTTTRFQAGAFSTSVPSLTDGPTMHAGLFEQFLSFATPETAQSIEPSVDRDNSPAIHPEQHTTDSNTTEAAASGEPIENHETTAEDEADQGAVEDQLAILAASTTVTTAVTAQHDEETSVRDFQHTQIVDKHLSAEQGEGEEARSGGLLITQDATNAVSTSDEKLEIAPAAVAEQEQTSIDASPATLQPVDKQSKQQTIAGTANTAQVQASGETFATSESLEPVEAAVEDVAQLNPLNAPQAPPTDARQQGRHRGEERSKWYERSSEPASLVQADDETPSASDATQADAAQTDATAQPLASELVADNQLSSEVRTLQTPSSTVAIENTVAVISGTIPVTELVVESLAGSHISAIVAGEASDGGASTSTDGVDAGGPTTRNNPSELKGAEPKGATAPAQRSDGLTQAERVRLVQRVSRSFARLGPTGGQVNIRLHPPQLGSLTIQVRMEGRTMTAKLSTESEAARDAIVESLPVLRGRLAEQGFEISSFQVEVADSNPDVTNNNQQSWSNQTDGSENNSGRQVDYRRIASQHRQPLEAVDRSSTLTESRELARQALSGIDLHA